MQGDLRTVAVALMLGASTFVAGDWFLDRRGASARKDPGGAQSEGSAQGIVLGSVLDGIPESLVLGLTVLQGGVGVPLVVGIALSNFPEGMASSSGLRAAGWPARTVLWMWTGVVLISGLAALVGYVGLDGASGNTVAAVNAYRGRGAAGHDRRHDASRGLRGGAEPRRVLRRARLCLLGGARLDLAASSGPPPRGRGRQARATTRRRRRSRTSSFSCGRQ